MIILLAIPVLAACVYMVRDGIRSGREADRIDAYFSRRKPLSSRTWRGE